MKVLDDIEISQLKSGDTKPLVKIFKANYSVCLHRVKQICNCQTVDAEDIIMEAIIILRDKIMMDNYENHNLQSFIISVAVNKWKNRKQKYDRVVYIDPETNSNINKFKVDVNVLTDAKQRELAAVRRALSTMKGKCGILLNRHLTDGISLELLVTELGYKSYDVIKSTKSRCMKKLRESIKLILKNENE